MGKSCRRVSLLVLAAVLVGIFLHWPGLTSGLAADDYQHRMMLDGTYPVSRSALNLYAFVHDKSDIQPLVDRGLLPWWTHPDLKLSAFRPLSSLLVSFDHRVLGSALAAHVHSLLWWALMVGCVAALLHRTLPRPVAMLATVAFAVDPAHVIPVAWLANRTTLVSVAFGALALWGHVRWREEEWKPGAWVSALGTTLALLGGEYGVGLVGYALAWELTHARDRDGGWATAVGGMAPMVAPTAAYLALHRFLGYGAVASSTYIDPLGQAPEFAAQALSRFPALLANELLTVPGELTHAALMLGAGGVLVLVPPLLAVAAMALGTFRRLEPRHRRSLGFLALGAGFSLLPLLGALPNVRLLVLPSVGGSAFIAALIVDAWNTLRASTAGWLGHVGRGLRVVMAALLFLAHLVVAPLATWMGAATWTAAQHAAHQSYLDAPMSDAPATLVNATGPGVLIYPPVVRRAHGLPAPSSWLVLTMTTGPFSLRRIDPNTLELRADGGVLSHPLAELFRAREVALEPGERLQAAGTRVEILDVGAHGPTRVRFHFGNRLAERNTLVHTPAGLEPIELPALGSTRSWP